MIYLATTEKKHENQNIHTFLDKKENWKKYFILVIASPEDQMLMGYQITRSKLAEVHWLLATVDEFGALIKKYGRPFCDLRVAEITMTGNKRDVFYIHNHEVLVIEHEPKTDPFDEVFAEMMNHLLEQIVDNFNEETKTFQKRIYQLFLGLIISRMFHMQPDPQKTIGTIGR